jgi:hypothetical protein
MQMTLDAVKTHPELLRFYENRGYQQVEELVLNGNAYTDTFVSDKVLVEVRS